jgi:hypothetical protein
MARLGEGRRARFGIFTFLRDSYVREFYFQDYFIREKFMAPICDISRPSSIGV